MKHKPRTPEGEFVKELRSHRVQTDERVRAATMIEELAAARDAAIKMLQDSLEDRRTVEDEFRAILDEASRLHKGDKWAILQIIRKLEWRAPR